MGSSLVHVWNMFQTRTIKILSNIESYRLNVIGNESQGGGVGGEGVLSPTSPLPLQTSWQTYINILNQYLQFARFKVNRIVRESRVTLVLVNWVIFN